MEKMVKMGAVKKITIAQKKGTCFAQTRVI